jgi:GNAT superfamily N-acetyltransferase
MVNSETIWKPLSAETWKDFERLFGERGACGGCWCMTWRRAKREFKAEAGAGNKAAMKKLMQSGEPAGILLYRDGEAVGWCSVAPRQQFVALERSRVWARLDDTPVWSVSCFFVAKRHRNQGLSVELLEAAAAYAKKLGAKVVEGYPQDLGEKALPAAFVWTGLQKTYERAGFVEVARRSAAKPIMRKQMTTSARAQGG